MANSNIDKLKSYIGLAQRANAVVYGEDIILEKIRLVKVVIVSTDATKKYQERLQSKLKGYPLFFTDNLQECLHRDNVNAIAIINENLANAIIDLLR